MPKRLNATRHFYVTRRLRDHIVTLRPGAMVPTVSELETRLDTSHGTLVRALATLTQEGLIERPAGRQRFRVALHVDRPAARIIFAHHDYPSPNYSATAQAIVHAAAGQNWKFDYRTFRSLEAVDLRRLSDGGDALVLIPTTESMPEHLANALRKPDKPVLILMAHVAEELVDNLTIDDVAAGRMAAEHLLTLGHRRLMLVLDQAHDTTIEARRQGWESAVGSDQFALLDAGVKPHQDALDVTYKALNRCLAEGPLDATGIFCTSEVGGVAALRALREAGIHVPEEVSVIADGGQSNIGAYLHPQMTTLEIDKKAFAQKAVSFLSHRLDGHPLAIHAMSIRPELYVRQSTASPPRP